MANELVPLPGRPGGSNGNGHGNGNGHSHGDGHDAEAYVPMEGKVWDPTVPAGFVDTDRQTSGMGWDLPPSDEPWQGYEAMRQARRDAEQADRDAEWARAHGLTSFAIERETDAADNRQMGWDWGDFRTWAIIWAMFFGFLLFSAFVYYQPHGRHNQNDGPLPVPGIRVYTCLKDMPPL